MYQKFETYISRNETAQPRSPFLHSCILERVIYSHDGSYLESLFSHIARENSWLNCRSGKKGRELAPSTGWRQFPALPSAPAVEPRVHIIDQHTNFQFGKFLIINGKKLIHVINVLFGLRVNEIPNKTFIWDSHQPIICSVW
jgi:hypothetical protein